MNQNLKLKLLLNKPILVRITVISKKFHVTWKTFEKLSEINCTEALEKNIKKWHVDAINERHLRVALQYSRL